MAPGLVGLAAVAELGVGVGGDVFAGGVPAGLAGAEHRDAGEVFGVVAQLDAEADQLGVDGVGVAGKRDAGGLGHGALGAPPAGVSQRGRPGDSPQRPGAGHPPLKWCLPGAVMHPVVVAPLDPGGPPPVELGEGGHLAGVDLHGELLGDGAIEPFLLAAPLEAGRGGCGPAGCPGGHRSA